ncbi:MAG: hypothetical protein GTO24_26985 [candidate division Zixibacteria bacterium]|nr:hypothetical protein [candidate division Zixibacteria bacterium]
MEQNCAVAITVVFIFAVISLAFLFPSGSGGSKRSTESNHEGEITCEDGKERRI